MAERKSFLIRIDPALWADLEAWAQAELRSINGQIEYLLKQAVARRKGNAAAPPVPAEPSPVVETSRATPPLAAKPAESHPDDAWID
jgi:hypothetical protein